MAQEDLLSIREAIDILSVPRQTVNQWIENGTLVPIRIAGALRFRPEDIRALFEKEGNSGRKRRILVIEDDALVGESLRSLFEKEGFEVKLALLGLAALDLAVNTSFDLIIADVRMPGMDGIQALKAIRELLGQFGKLPVPEIVLTAYDDPSVREEAQRMGVREFLLKPFETNELMNLLRKHLNIKRAQAQPGSKRETYS